jgi:hypothetical protein
MSLVGVKASIDDLEVADTHAEGASMVGFPFELVASGCAELEGQSLRVEDNDPFDVAYGILIDGAGAKLGTDADHGISVKGNASGIWLLNTSSERPVQLQHGVLEANRGVGLGLGGSTVGIIVNYFQIRKTSLDKVPVKKGDAATVDDVGDGLIWLGGAQASIDDLTMSGSARASVLIDGAVAAGSSLTHVTLEGGDEAKGIVQQSFTTGDEQPMVGDGTPAITADATEKFSVPVAPTAPAAN